jgi:hypothetical protein
MAHRSPRASQRCCEHGAAGDGALTVCAQSGQQTRCRSACVRKPPYELTVCKTFMHAQKLKARTICRWTSHAYIGLRMELVAPAVRQASSGSFRARQPGKHRIVTGFHAAGYRQPLRCIVLYVLTDTLMGSFAVGAPSLPRMLVCPLCSPCAVWSTIVCSGIRRVYGHCTPGQLVYAVVVEVVDRVCSVL